MFTKNNDCDRMFVLEDKDFEEESKFKKNLIESQCWWKSGRKF